MSDSIPAVVFTSENTVEIRSFPRPKCTAGKILCRTRYSTISPGTELRTLRGEQNGARFPLVPGYAWIGQVEEVASDVVGFRVGDWVCGRSSDPLEGADSTWGGHGAVHAAPATGYAATIKIPAGVDPLDCVLMELGAISWRGVSMCLPLRGESAVVCGQGIIGALAAQWLVQAGVRVVALDLDARRLERARRLGCLTVDGAAPDAADQVRALAGGAVDIAVEASASLSGARLVAPLLRNTQAAAVSGSYRPDDGPRLANYWPRLCILASFTKKMELAPKGLLEVEGALVLAPGDRRVQDRMAVQDRIRLGQFKPRDFVDAPVPYTRAPDLYPSLRDEPAKALTHVMSWE